MPTPAILYYVVDKTLGISRNVTAYIVIVSDGETARRAELKIPDNQDPKTLIEQRLQTLWASGKPATMQEYRQAQQRADNPLLNDILDAVAVIISHSATPTIANVFLAAEAVIPSGTPRYDEWVKLTNLYQQMTDDERSRFLALLTLILLSKSQQT